MMEIWYERIIFCEKNLIYGSADYLKHNKIEKK